MPALLLSLLVWLQDNEGKDLGFIGIQTISHCQDSKCSYEDTCTVTFCSALASETVDISIFYLVCQLLSCKLLESAGT